MGRTEGGIEIVFESRLANQDCCADWAVLMNLLHCLSHTMVNTADAWGTLVTTVSVLPSSETVSS